MSDNDGSSELSSEGEEALKAALSVLTEGRGGRARVNELDGQRQAVIEGHVVPSMSSRPELAGTPEAQVELRHISRRDEIPLAENHVLVMWGLSTYRADHPRGVTLVVNNGRSNRDRDGQFRAALGEAVDIARNRQLPCIYILD